jgi:hypothetical protein
LLLSEEYSCMKDSIKMGLYNASFILYCRYYKLSHRIPVLTNEFAAVRFELIWITMDKSLVALRATTK